MYVCVCVSVSAREKKTRKKYQNWEKVNNEAGKETRANKRWAEQKQRQFSETFTEQNG